MILSASIDALRNDCGYIPNTAPHLTTEKRMLITQEVQGVKEFPTQVGNNNSHTSYGRKLTITENDRLDPTVHHLSTICSQQ